MITEQSKGNESVRIDRIHERIRVNAHTRSVNDKLVHLGEALQEKLNAGANQNENLDGSTFDDDPHLEIGFTACTGSLDLGERELTMGQSLVKIQD